jgi:hypothetical protein
MGRPTERTLTRAEARSFYDKFGSKQDEQAFYEDAALSAMAVGIVQFWINGTVSIRPWHDPASGDAVVEILPVLFVVSVAFTVDGRVMIRRARRMIEQ